MPLDPLGLRAARELAFLPRLRTGERFSHLSAARIWGMPLPARADPSVHVVAPLTLDRVRRRGVVHHRRAGTTSTLAGLPVSSPIDTFIELATRLDHEDLVAVGDWITLAPRRPARTDLRP